LPQQGLRGRLVRMNINELVNRPQMYVLEDGTTELAIGVMCLIAISVFRFAQGRDLLLVPQAIWVGLSLGVFWGAKKVKEITSGRGGYVALDQQAGATRWGIRRRTLRIVLVLGLVALFRVVQDVFRSPAAGALACSAIFIGAYVFPGLKYRLAYMLGLAAFSALLGGWAYARNDTLVFVLVWQGSALAIVGGVKLVRFLMAHPRVAGAVA
jgi:hypothetical protein